MREPLVDQSSLACSTPLLVSGACEAGGRLCISVFVVLENQNMEVGFSVQYKLVVIKVSILVHLNFSCIGFALVKSIRCGVVAVQTVEQDRHYCSRNFFFFFLDGEDVQASLRTVRIISFPVWSKTDNPRRELGIRKKSLSCGMTPRIEL